MPIYDYLCASCGHVTEVIHGINEVGPRFCPNCGAEGTLRKGVTTPAILFKGSGWAKKDRSATRSPASKRSGGESGSGGDSASGGDSGSGGGSGSNPDPAGGGGSPATTDGGSATSPAGTGSGGD